MPNFSLRVPRYIELKWIPPQISTSNFVLSQHSVKENLNNIIAEEDFANSKYVSCTFNNANSVQYAYLDILGNSQDNSSTSQATIIDNFVSSLLKNYAETEEESNVQSLRKQLIDAITSIEKVADKPDKTLGYKFYDSNNQKIVANSGFEEIIGLNSSILNSQINSIVLPDIFVSASLSKETIKNFNEKYQFNSLGGSNDPTLAPVEVAEEIDPGNLDLSNYAKTSSLIAYIIERYESKNNSFKKTKTIVVENASTTTAIDATIKYGTNYYYSIRTIAKISMHSIDSNGDLKKCIYYVASRPVTTQIICDEDVAPPPPNDLYFNWNYSANNLNISWTMPFNHQRDIKQFQVFRRKSIYEPFELLQQICFDFSSLKHTTGESIDGNRLDMSKDEKFFVSYKNAPFMSFVDEEFKIDSDSLTSSKYIYAIASIDAHGYISNYSAQFEISFDFFKNKIVKKYISEAGAPRPYPNLLLNSDLFKDVIDVSGLSSVKMKVYFMPEYFKLQRNNGVTEKMVATQQDQCYYKLQFINTQNQKSDSLKISIDDPQGFVKQ